MAMLCLPKGNGIANGSLTFKEEYYSLSYLHTIRAYQGTSTVDSYIVKQALSRCNSSHFGFGLTSSSI